MAENNASVGPVYALGLMSGTSLDGIDAALIRTDGEQVYEFGPWLTVPYEAGLRQDLRGIVEGNGGDASEVEVALTEAHAAAASAMMAKAGYGNLRRGRCLCVAGFERGYPLDEFVPGRRETQGHHPPR